MAHYAVAYQEVLQAHERIQPWIHRTPVMTCATIDRLAGKQLFFKCEQWQRAGAFKYRGATNAILQLSGADARRGVVTHSSGNHAQALALAAQRRGIAAHIVMPSNASLVKKNAVLGYGAHVVECEPTLTARETTVAEVQSRTGAVLIPPYNHPHIIAGQGTAALELLQEVADLDAVVAPVGGGGLLAGTCIAAKGLSPRIRVFAAEPLGADDAARSKAAGTLLILQSQPRTIADGLLTSLGDLTWPILRDEAEAVVTVDEPEIVQAMRWMWERAKLMIEPSSAVAVAAVLADAFRSLPGMSRVGVILSGGNVNLDQLPWASPRT